MKKFFLLACAFVALVAILCFVPASAENIQEDIPLEDSLVDDVVAEIPESDEPAPDNLPPEDSIISEEPLENNAQEVPLTQLLTALIEKYYGHATGSATVIGLFVLSFVFRKRLIPVVNSAIQSVATRSEASEKKYSDGIRSSVELLELEAKHVDDLGKGVEKLVGEVQRKLTAQNKAYELQTDLINYLLMNLRIPNELKAEVAERSSAVKAAIEEANREA